MKNKFFSFSFLIIGLCILMFEGFSYSVFASQTSWSEIKKIMTVIFENADLDDTLEQPFFSEFAKKGALFKEFFAETHPSQPNYIALTSGSTHDVDDDDAVTLDVKNIVDLLEKNGRSWKVYAEKYPGKCFLGERSRTYVRKHVPFLSYLNIQNNPRRCAHIVEASELKTDIKKGTIPDYSFYVPDMKNDGHDTDVGYASRWFSTAFGPLIKDRDFMDGMLLIATFDEGEFFGTNRIFTAMVGDSVIPGSESSNHYDHYSLLRTIEHILDLGTLGLHDEEASVIEGIWTRSEKCRVKDAHP